LQELGYYGSCLFVWYICLCAFWYICVPVVCLLSIFIFILLHLSFDCIVAEIVSFYHVKFWVKSFLIARYGFILSIFVDVICVILTSSTSLEYWIHLVLMNLQDVGQTSIEVAWHKCRATAVQVCGLNPAGWSILWRHGL
jgi:hypothetical protein